MNCRYSYVVYKFNIFVPPYRIRYSFYPYVLRVIEKALYGDIIEASREWKAMDFIMSDLWNFIIGYIRSRTWTFGTDHKS